MESSSSSTINHTNEHLFSFQTSSYDDILSKIPKFQTFEPDHQTLILKKILNPSTRNLQNHLSLLQHRNHSTSISLTGVLTSYFEESERTSLFCLRLHHCVSLTRSTYSHLHNLLDKFPIDCSSPAQYDCDSAYDLLRGFDEVENPFSIQHINEIRTHHTRIGDKIRVLQRSGNNPPRSISNSSSSDCVSLRGCGWIRLLDVSRKGGDKQFDVVDAVDRGNFVMWKYIDTICSLVCRLHTSVGGDKFFVHLVLEKSSSSSSGMYPIKQVVAQLRRKQEMFIHQLKELELQICIFFAIVNNVRSRILSGLKMLNLVGSSSCDSSSSHCFK